MSALSAKFLLHRVARYCFVPVVCCSALAFTSPVSLAGVESARGHLEKIFGTPETFSEKFERTVKERSDQIIGLLTAAAGFSYVVKVFL